VKSGSVLKRSSKAIVDNSVESESRKSSVNFADAEISGPSCGTAAEPLLLPSTSDPDDEASDPTSSLGRVANGGDYPHGEFPSSDMTLIGSTPVKNPGKLAPISSPKKFQSEMLIWL